MPTKRIRPPVDIRELRGALGDLGIFLPQAQTLEEIEAGLQAHSRFVIITEEMRTLVEGFRHRTGLQQEVKLSQHRHAIPPPPLPAISTPIPEKNLPSRLDESELPATLEELVAQLKAHGIILHDVKTFAELVGRIDRLNTQFIVSPQVRELVQRCAATLVGAKAATTTMSQRPSELEGYTVPSPAPVVMAPVPDPVQTIPATAVEVAVPIVSASAPDTIPLPAPPAPPQPVRDEDDDWVPRSLPPSRPPTSSFAVEHFHRSIRTVKWYSDVPPKIGNDRLDGYGSAIVGRNRSFSMGSPLSGDAVLFLRDPLTQIAILARWPFVRDPREVHTRLQTLALSYHRGPRTHEDRCFFDVLTQRLQSPDFSAFEFELRVTLREMSYLSLPAARLESGLLLFLDDRQHPLDHAVPPPHVAQLLSALAAIEIPIAATTLRWTNAKPNREVHLTREERVLFAGEREMIRLPGETVRDGTRFFAEVRACRKLLRTSKLPKETRNQIATLCLPLLISACERQGKSFELAFREVLQEPVNCR